MNIIQSLKNLGLSEKEAKVYTALLQTNKATAYEVAKYSGLKKPTTYVILDELVDKGIAIKIPRVKTMHYSAISPEDLFAIAQSRIKTAKEALPELKAISKGRAIKKVRVAYYEGLDGVKEMYRKLHREIPGKNYVGFFAHAKNTPEELNEVFDEINEKQRKLRIGRKAITVDDKSLSKYFSKEYLKKHNMEIKKLPISKYDSNISIEVYKNYTQIFSHRYLQGIVIDNPDIAKTMKQIFKIVWEGTRGEKRNGKLKNNKTAIV